MRQSKGSEKSSVKPFINPTNTKSTAKKTSQRKLQNNNHDLYSGLDLCAVISLYVFLVLSFLIGGGGIAVCVVYYNANADTKNWKIAGIALGALTCLLSIILIFLAIFKRTSDRPWRYTKDETLLKDDFDQMSIEDIDENDIQDYITEQILGRNSLSQSIHSLETKRRETASSPIPNSSYEPLKKLSSDLIFCPGCNTTHPSAHRCMYSTGIANNSSILSQVSTKDATVILTEDNSKKKNEAHTTIDRSLKYSVSSETQTNVPAKPSSNTADNVVFRRVLMPTTKVSVQQATTKVMIVRVPNVAGQLVIQPRETTTDEKQYVLTLPTENV